MDVGSVLEGADHRGIAGQGSHDAELDLRVIAGEEGAALARYEGLADLAAGGGSDGDVLEIRVGGGEAAGGGDELVEGGVDAAGFQLDVIWEGIEVCGFQFRSLAPGKNFLDDGVHAKEGGECLLVGLVLAGFGLLRLVEEVQVVEEDLAELLGGAEIEGGAGVAFDCFCELVNGLLEIDADGIEGIRVDGDAFHFHAHEHREQRTLDGGPDFVLSGFLEERAELFRDLPGDVGVLGGVFGENGEGNG